jgi:hypothetical protein
MDAHSRGSKGPLAQQDPFHLQRERADRTRDDDGHSFLVFAVAIVADWPMRAQWRYVSPSDFEKTETALPEPVLLQLCWRWHGEVILTHFLW